MRKLTLRFLQQKNACDDGSQWWIDNGKEPNAIAVVGKLIAEDRFNWANWLIVRLMNHDQQIKYSIYAAEQVIEIYETKYPDDPRPCNAIKAAKKYLKNKTSENKEAAYTASYYAAEAAYAAAYTASYAAYTASYAAYTASYYAAEAAYAAAYVASYAAPEAAAQKEMQIKILNYGIKLLSETMKLDKEGK